MRGKGAEMDENSKEALIDHIIQLNNEVSREFLRGFDVDELLSYLSYLANQDLERVEICC
jgi:hypothetical protein